MEKHNPIRVLHVIGQLEIGGVSSWLKALISCADRSRLAIDICCNYRLGSGELTQEFSGLGCAIHHIPLDYNLPRYQSNLMKLLLQGNYEIVHDHRGFLAGATLRAAHKAGVGARIAYHHTSNDDILPDLPRRIYEALLRRWTLKYATHLWGCSNTALAAQYGADWKSRDRRLDVVYGAICLDKPGPHARERVREEFGIGISDRVIGFVGRMTRAKNPFVALEVCNKLVENDRSVKVLWVGDGPLLGDIRSRADKFRFKDNFKFTGFRKDVPDLLCAMDVYFLPSLWEGLSLSKLEALRAGLPVVGSRDPGVLEALPQEYRDLCSEASDVEGHARSIIKGLNTARNRIMPKDVLETFTPENLRERILFKYEKAIQIKQFH